MWDIIKHLPEGVFAVCFILLPALLSGQLKREHDDLLKK